ncbi:hypothetical protein ACIBCN_38840 [Nocardia sp. NPDC051052]|uniref:hypothetical protein n=1 Tax=Nocardia sp. NPDC051052 TaxID=3364322 RepID=UPI0037B1D694
MKSLAQTVTRGVVAVSIGAAISFAYGTIPAHADTQSVGCGDHNQQAVISSTNGFFLCFEGTGQSWTSTINGVVSIWSGPYTVVASTGQEDPVIVPPYTTNSDGSGRPYTIIDVQLLQL